MVVEVDERASLSRREYLSEEEQLILVEIETCTEDLEKALERLGRLRREHLSKIRASVWTIHAEVFSAISCLLQKKAAE